MKRSVPHHLRHPGVDADPLRDGRLHNFRTQPLPRARKVRDPLRLMQQNWSVTTAPAQILPERPNRRYVLIQNASTSASTVRVAFGTVSGPTVGFELPPGASLEMKDPAPADFVSVVVASGTATLNFVDG